MRYVKPVVTKEVRGSEFAMLKKSVASNVLWYVWGWIWDDLWLKIEDEIKISVIYEIWGRFDGGEE